MGSPLLKRYFIAVLEYLRSGKMNVMGLSYVGQILHHVIYDFMETLFVFLTIYFNELSPSAALEVCVVYLPKFEGCPEILHTKTEVLWSS